MNYELSQRIARAALEMVALVDKRKEADRALSIALDECFFYLPEVDGYSEYVQMFELGHFANDYKEWQQWVYSKHMGEKAGQDCTSDPLWIAQNKAWEALKLARQKAGYAKAALTRLCRRENGK